MGGTAKAKGALRMSDEEMSDEEVSKHALHRNMSVTFDLADMYV